MGFSGLELQDLAFSTLVQQDFLAGFGSAGFGSAGFGMFANRFANVGNVRELGGAFDMFFTNASDNALAALLTIPPTTAQRPIDSGLGAQ